MRLPVILSLVIICAAAVGVWQMSDATPARLNATPPSDKGAMPAAKIGGNFTLLNTQGDTVTQQSLRGKYALIYFGFTFCPDICPTGLLTMTQALEGLEPLSQNITPVFITIDPQRDTVDVMKAYMSNFHPRFVGLTGTPEQTDAAAKAYKVFYRLHKEDDNDENYVVDHTGLIYLMSPEGAYVAHFTHEDSAETMMAILTKHLR